MNCGTEVGHNYKLCVNRFGDGGWGSQILNVKMVRNFDIPSDKFHTCYLPLRDTFIAKRQTIIPVIIIIVITITFTRTNKNVSFHLKATNESVQQVCTLLLDYEFSFRNARTTLKCTAGRLACTKEDFMSVVMESFFFLFLISSSYSSSRYKIDVPSLMFGCQDGRLEIWPGLVCIRTPVSTLV